MTQQPVVPAGVREADLAQRLYAKPLAVNLMEDPAILFILPRAESGAHDALTA